jgi:hypothetical protein
MTIGLRLGADRRLAAFARRAGARFFEAVDFDAPARAGFRLAAFFMLDVP